jgi:2-oxoglutarate ferredoxin oxidoreductase subunit alpha
VVGGPQGSGVDSAATIYARACAFGGLHVYGEREYYSNIKGEHSYFAVMAADAEISSRYSKIHILASFEPETIFRHAWDVLPGGAIVFDPDSRGDLLSQLPTVEKSVVRDILSRKGGASSDCSVGDVLDIVVSKGVNVVPLSFTKLLEDVGRQIGEEPGKLTRFVNVMAVAASLSLFGYDFPPIEKAIGSVFKSKPKVAEQNTLAARMAYAAVEKDRPKVKFKLMAVSADEPRLLVTGAQAVALGKIAGGGRFQSYYPITPASDESYILEEHEAFGLKGEGIKNYYFVLQAEDEIAAITMAIGAALTGVRSSTATSGPGFCLMMEGLGWSGMNEVPLVVTLYQRGGPSTGLPTRTEQGDLLFALAAGHGEFPRIVFSSGDIEESFYDAQRAFNYAERFQVPVIHLVDKAVANATSTVRRFDASLIKIERGSMLTADQLASGKPYKRFEFTESGVSPRAVVGQPGIVFWNTGDEHDETGHITEDPELRVKMMEKRMGKLDLIAKEIPLSEKLTYYGEKDPDLLVVGWGSVKGAVLDNLEALKEDGIKAGFLQIRMMCPFPADEVKGILKSAKRVMIVECNYSGQLRKIIAQETGVVIPQLIAKYTGRPVLCDELLESLERLYRNGNVRKEVLTVGA